MELNFTIKSSRLLQGLESQTLVITTISHESEEENKGQGLREQEESIGIKDDYVTFVRGD